MNKAQATNANLPTVHELKVWQQYFGSLQSGIKTFEVRIDDRNYKIGDELILREYDPETEFLTGRFIHRRVSYILNGGQFGIKPGYIVIQLAKI